MIVTLGLLIWPLNCAVPSMDSRGGTLFRNTFVRYLFAIATVASAFVLRLWLIPLTSAGAPFVLFFAAILVTSRFAGVGPGICAVVLSMPLGAYSFGIRAGYSVAQVSFQSLLFAVDGLIVVYLMFLINRKGQAADDALQQLRGANEEVTRSAVRTREIIELSPDAFFQADLDARLTDVNQAACRLLGYDQDELIRQTIFEIVPVEDRSRLKAVRAELLVPGHVHRAEWSLKRKDGTFVLVEVSTHVLPDGRWQAFVRDISERKRVEEALRESEERFRLTVDQAPIGMALVALDGHFVRVNRALCEIVGYSSTELTELTFQDITHPDGLDVDLAASAQLARGDIPRYHREKRYIRKDGTIVNVLLSASILRSRDGAPLYFISQIEDITERKRAEEALRRSEFQYRGLIEHMPDGVFAHQDGRIVYANGAFVHLLGYDAPSALVGRLVFELLHPDDRPAVAERIRALQQTGIPAPPREFRMIGRDGSYRSVETVKLQAQFEGQASIVVIARDLTERKRSEEALRVVSAELRQTLHTAATGLTHCSRDLRYLSANPAYAQFVGLPVDQIVGRPIIEVMGRASFAIIHPRIERVLRGEQVEYEDELPIAGERKWVHAVYTPDRDASGNVVGWVASVRDVTLRKRAEEELKAANASLDAIIENIPLVLFLKDAKSLRYLRLNRAGEDLLGWPKEMFTGKNDYDLWPRPQADSFVEKDREALKGRMIDIAEEPLQTHYQGVRLLHTKKVPILDAAGQPIYLLGISEDITERRRVEKEQQFLAEVNLTLSASLDYEQTLATVARLVVQDMADWCAIDVMDEQEQLTRLKVACADPAKAPLCALLEQLPLDRDLPHIMRSAVESKRPIVVEQVTSRYIESLGQGPGHLQALLATGVTSFVAVPLLMRGQALGALFLGSSTPSRVVGQGDLRLAEALADRAATAIENARLYRASVHTAQLQQVLSEAGAALASSLDYEQTLATVAQLVVRDFADWCLVEVIDEREQIRQRKIVAADPSKADLCALLEHMPIDRDRPHLLRPVFDTKQPFLIEHVTSEHLESAAQGPEHLQALRAVNPTSLMALPLLRYGRLLGILAFVSSTESRRYGRSDLRLAEALAERAAIAIENARLYRASVHATQLRDQVLGVVAHDLRNPLSTILTQLWAVRPHTGEPERRSVKPAQVIERAAKRMNRLIQDLLDVAVIESGQLAIERARLSAAGLVVDVADMQRSLASSSSLELRIESDSNVPEVWGDRNRLLQVFENLIGNAIKFTKAGGCITVGATSRDHQVVFRVADTGSGIAPENLPRVFDRFWQATRTDRQGAGLGLPITKGIVEAHGGRIWVESTPNRGTTFFFTIPQATPEHGRPSGSSQSSISEGYRAA